MVLTVLVGNAILIELSFFLLPCKTANNYGGHARQRWGKGSLLECILRIDPAGVSAEVWATTAQGVPSWQMQTMLRTSRDTCLSQGFKDLERFNRNLALCIVIQCETINDSFSSLLLQPNQVTGYLASSKKGCNPLRSLGKAVTTPATLLCLTLGAFRPSCVSH